MRTEQLLVREVFLAGLIDAMGYPALHFTFVGVKLVTMYTPIKEAIVFVAEPLALNVSCSHEAAGSRPERYFYNVNWILHNSPGDNPEIFWSIVGMCSSQRKKDSLRRERCEETIDFTQCEEEENNAPALDDEVALNNNAIRFKVVFSGSREVVKIMCEEGKNFLLQNRVITPGSFLEDESSRPIRPLARKCLCCKSEETHLQWYKVTWNLESKQRLCSRCYGNYRISCTRCLDVSCQKVVIISGLPPGRTIQSYRDTGELLHCSCGAVTETNFEMLEQRENKISKIQDNYQCIHCWKTRLGTRRNSPVDKSQPSCDSCYKKYGQTRTACTNPSCGKIPSITELRQMQDSSDEFKCLECGSRAQQDTGKAVKQREPAEKKSGECPSCIPSSQQDGTHCRNLRVRKSAIHVMEPLKNTRYTALSV